MRALSPRCPTHGSVLRPDGTCVLCHSRAPQEPPTHWGRLLLGILIAVVAMGLFVKLRSRPESTSAHDALVRASESVKRVEVIQSPSVANSVGTRAGSGGASRFEHAAFVERDPRGFRAELHARGERELTGDYQAKDESFEIVFPENVAETESVGLLVWISASQSGALPRPDWARVLAAHRLVFIGPNRAGNEREIASRLGLALDSVLAARRRINLDMRRLFIGGISGGAKTAFRALLYFPEVFRGALLCAGIEYIRDVPIPSHPGSFWPRRIGVPSDLDLAKRRSIAITTGPKDFNYAQIHDVVATLGRDEFSHVAILESPELAHEEPPAQLFEQALDWLEGPAK